MNNPKVSVVIPSYNQADFLAEAIQSILEQTYSNFEIIVVNDASPDHTSDIVRQFDDPRVNLILHKDNRGLPAARNSGMRASSGDIIALLDSDDFFHPEKLQAHVTFLNQNPDVGVSYNARFDLNHSANTIRDLWRPPLNVNLADLVCGFPFSPSDMVLRREWAFRVGLFDEQFVSGGEDLDFPCRLALAGCRFASVDRALNYRRYHSGKRKKNVPGRFKDYKNALNRTFNHPGCPEEVLALQDTAFTNHYLELVFLTFAQEETDLGQMYVREAIRLSPSLLDGEPCRLMRFLLVNSIMDESKSHEVLLHKILAQLPSEISWLSNQYDWVVAQGYLLRGARAVIWGRLDDGCTHFEQAAKLEAQFDKTFLRDLAAQLTSYEVEFGAESAQHILSLLSFHLEKIGGAVCVRWLRGKYMVNQAFQSYRAGKYHRVPKSILVAVTQDPKYLANRGVLSILVRSAVGMWPQLKR